MCETQKTGCLCNGKTHVELARDRMFQAETEAQAERKHTPLPIEIAPFGKKDGVYIRSVNEPDMVIAKVCNREQADFIVLACNKYYPLLEIAHYVRGSATASLAIKEAVLSVIATPTPTPTEPATP